jgi:hypothetical protein
MKIRREKESTVGSQFDELAKTFADGLTRRKTLQLIGGSVTGVLVSLGIPKSWGATTKGCGQICKPLFNTRDQTAFNSCTAACEDCKFCNGTPSLPAGPNLQLCVCQDGIQIEVCAQVDCFSGPDQDRICGPICASHGGEQATGCLFGDPGCVTKLNCVGAKPCRSARGELVCCQVNTTCCGGACLPPCSLGLPRNPDCTCGGPNRLSCFCADGSQIDVCAQVECENGRDMDRFCGPACAAHGGEVATGACFGDPSCTSS